MKVNISFTKLEDFASEYPSLAKKVQKQKFVVEDPYVYHLTRGGNVERQAVIDNPFYEKRWGMPMEKSRSRRKNIRTDYAKYIVQAKQKAKPKTLWEIIDDAKAKSNVE